jgi:glycosyltransferase involved in cell wall biosynthesis
LDGPEVPSGHVTIVAAMHLERALIVTASSGIEDYVKNRENGLTVPVADASTLAAAIRKLWNDQSLCKFLADNGKLFASTHCTEENIARQFQSQFLDLMHSRS